MLKFNSASKFRRLVQYTPSKQIAAQNTKITKLAEQRMVVSLQLTTLLKGEQARNRKPPSKGKEHVWRCVSVGIWQKFPV